MGTNFILRNLPPKWQYIPHKLIIDYEIYLLYSQMQNKQTCHVIDVVHAPYFQDTHSILIHNQSLNAIIVY